MSYIPPDKTSVNFTMAGGYSAPTADSVNFLLGESEVYFTVLSDMALDIQAFCNSVTDASLDIATGYQCIEFCSVDVQALGEIICDNMLDITLGLLCLIDHPLSIGLAKEINLDAVLDILLSTGIITNNVAMDINVGDGNKMQDFGIDIMAVTSRPAFRYVYAMNLSSVIKEIQA